LYFDQFVTAGRKVNDIHSSIPFRQGAQRKCREWLPDVAKTFVTPTENALLWMDGAFPSSKSKSVTDATADDMELMPNATAVKTFLFNPILPPST
jgi:fido (protein-threonine AMPylation protein)